MLNLEYDVNNHNNNYQDENKMPPGCGNCGCLSISFIVAILTNLLHLATSNSIFVAILVLLSNIVWAIIFIFEEKIRSEDIGLCYFFAIVAQWIFCGLAKGEALSLTFLITIYVLVIASLVAYYITGFINTKENNNSKIAIYKKNYQHFKRTLCC